MTTSSFTCSRCGARHDRLEIGFRLPDAAFALALSDEERSRLAASDEPDSIEVRDASFVRGVALLRVADRVDARDTFGIGFWAQLAPEALRDHARRDAPHPAYAARVANQAMLLAPTLGLAARVEYAGVGLRPRITLSGTHPLTRAQQSAGGIADEVVTGWLEEQAHVGEPVLPGEPVVAELARDGWQLLAPDDVGRAPLAAAGWNARAGDLVKVAIRWLAADVHGDTVALLAAVWVRIDVVTRADGWLGGVLDNHLRVPGTIELGARMWMRPDFPLDLDRA